MREKSEVERAKLGFWSFISSIRSTTHNILDTTGHASNGLHRSQSMAQHTRREPNIPEASPTYEVLLLDFIFNHLIN
jgi:hypothetical protein